MKTVLISIFLLAPLLADAATGPRLTLDAYLNQVSNQSPGVAAARLSAESGFRRAEGASVLTFPYLFGNFNTYEDKAETAFPIQQGTRTQGTLYTMGLGMNTPFGLNGKYSWNTSYVDTTGIPLATAGRYTSYNRLDLTMNLVRNGFGSEIRARKELIEAGNTAQALGAKFEHISRLTEGEATYWRLAFARQAVIVHKEVLARADKLLDWAKKRVGNQLGDRGDLLQAQASHDLHSLELTTAVDEERNIARAFNLLRNQDGESVPEAVAVPSMEETLKMETPERETDRLDLQAAAERTKVAKAQVQIDKENLRPNVDIVAVYAWNGRDAERSGAVSEATGSRHPTTAIGLNFTVPLNVPTWSRSIKGANLGIEAAGYALEQSRLEEAKEWRELSQRLIVAKARLQLTKTLETVQREKFENEGQRLQRGRTTTYQTVTFEQDYAQAQLLRLRTQAEVLQILAQMKSFRGNP